MKSETAIKRELRAVRAALAKRRAAGEEDGAGVLYGAQQALGWIVEDLAPPSRYDRIIDKIAAHWR